MRCRGTAIHPERGFGISSVKGDSKGTTDAHGGPRGAKHTEKITRPWPKTGCGRKRVANQRRQALPTEEFVGNQGPVVSEFGLKHKDVLSQIQFV